MIRGHDRSIRIAVAALVWLAVLAALAPTGRTAPPDQLPCALVTAGPRPVAVDLNQCRITLAPHAQLLLRCLAKAATVASAELLHGGAAVQAVGARAPQILWQASAGLQPGRASTLVGTFPRLNDLLPDRPTSFFLTAPGAAVSGPGPLPLRALLDGRHYLLDERLLLPLAEPSPFVRTDPSASTPALVVTLSNRDDCAYTVSPADLPFHVGQTIFEGVTIRTNDVYERQSMPFDPTAVSFSLDPTGDEERAVGLSFSEDLKAVPPIVANACRTGRRAALRFVTQEGYIVVLGPRTNAIITMSFGPGSTGTRLQLEAGAAMILPPPDADVATPEAIAPLHFEGAAPFEVKHGGSLFLADGADKEHLVPVLASLHRRYRLEKSIAQRMGNAQYEWRRFADALSSAGVPTTTGATSPIDVLDRLARARAFSTPLFTPVATLPCRQRDFLERAAVHVDGGLNESTAYFGAVGPRDRSCPVPVDLSTFVPHRAGNRLEVFSSDRSTRLILVDWFRSRLPGAKDDERLTGYRPTSLYVFRDRSHDVSRPRRILHAEEVGSVKKAQDWLQQQMQERPYRTACVGILVLALFMYVMAKGPKQVLVTLWRLLTFFRGEPCHRCGMPLEKFLLTTLPLDHHLAIPARLIYFGGSLSPEELVQGLPATLDLSADVPADLAAKLTCAVDGDCVWCLRCGKGQVRFRLLEGGKIREEAKHPILLPHFMEFLRRWRDDAART